MKRFVETLTEARRIAKAENATYRKVCGGWLVMDYHTARIWDNQK